MCSTVEEMLEKWFTFSCSNSNLLNSFSTQWDFTNDIKTVYSIQVNIFTECQLYAIHSAKILGVLAKQTRLSSNF